MTNNSVVLARKVIYVLGANRSGTSLLMQILVKMGLEISNNLIAANLSNAEGFFEDADIVKIHTALYDCLKTPAYLPLPENWVNSECARIAKRELKMLMGKRIEESTKLFGIKDPRTSNFLPLWRFIFNELSLIPIFVLAVREPRHMVISYTQQYSATHSMAELVWLLRTLEALENTAADCFVAHYEDWFSEPKQLSQALLRYTGLDQDFKGNLSDVLANTIKPNLNRASMNDYEVQNPYVLKLYAALQECHGADFDRERLMAVVKECRQAMEGFKGWYQLAHQANKKLADTLAQLEKVTAEAARVKSLEARIQALEKEKAQCGQLAVQVQRLQRQLDQLMALGAV
jgi:hypothetical protein